MTKEQKLKTLTRLQAAQDVLNGIDVSGLPFDELDNYQVIMGSLFLWEHKLTNGDNGKLGDIDDPGVEAFVGEVWEELK